MKQEQGADQEKEMLCRKFSRAAENYDKYAQVQKKCAIHLLETLPSGFWPGSILEIGCGNGNYSRLLKGKYPDAAITALDFSGEMVETARRKTPDKDIFFLRREAEEFLAKEQGEFSLITSNATLQWFKDLAGAFRNMAGILRRDGLIHVSVFGSGSLIVLGEALREVVDPSLALPSEKFTDYAFLRQAASPYFNDLEIEEIKFDRRCSSFLELLAQIHKTGTGGFTPTVPRFTRGSIAELDKRLTGADGFTVTYQVFFLTASGKRDGDVV
ncbi:MAG: methyltransferase domain-containing protein [Thermodesulfobacteriota bacterium]